MTRTIALAEGVTTYRLADVTRSGGDRTALSAGERAAALAEYQQVTEQFRALTDIRFKLLGLLPLGTVAALFLPDDGHALAHPAVAVFAFVVTVCLATYNRRNDQHYDELVARAAHLERTLGLVHGSFTQRPTSWLSYFSIRVEHRWPIGLVYTSTAALWAYVIGAAVLEPLVRGAPSRPSVLLIVLGHMLAPALVLAVWLQLRKMAEDRRRAVRAAIRELESAFADLGDDDEKLAAVAKRIAAHEKLLGKDEKDARRRLAYHWKAARTAHVEDELTRASLALAGVVDLPARWIHDVWTGRR